MTGSWGSWNIALRASLVCALLCLSLFPVSSWDVFWHLRVAQDILATHAYPHGDIYSFSRPGGMYVEDEWLFQVGAYLVQRTLGWDGLVAAKALLMVAAGVLLYLETRILCGSPAIAAMYVALGAAAARSRLLERPDSLNLFFFPAFLVVLSAYRRTGRGRLLWLLPPLFGLWGNCHSGATLGLIVFASMAGADVVCQALPSLLPQASAGRGWHELLAAAASAAFALINPIGTRLFTFPFEVVGVRGTIHRTIEWQPTPVAMFPLFFVLGAAFLVGSALAVRAFDLAEIGSTALLLALGLRHVRMMGMFAIISSLPLARLTGVVVGTLPIPRSAWQREAWRHRVYAAVCGALLAMAAWFALVNDYHALGTGLEKDHYPIAAAEFIARERPPAEMWNEFTYGGYLLWRLYPTYRVFVDNREEPYYSLLREIQEAMRSPQEFARHLDRYRINFAVLRYSPQPVMARGPDGRPFPRGFWSQYFPAADWPLVYWDDVAMIRVRRAAVDPAWLDRLEERAIDPDDWWITAAMARRDPLLGDAARQSLDRKLAADPLCRRARALRAEIDGTAGAEQP